MGSSFTDIHTHILPAFDDGAENLEVSLEILRNQRKNGIVRVALTPHFYPINETLESFLERREKAYTELMSGWDEDTMPSLCLGAEVRFSAKLTHMDLEKLTIGGSDYMLIELPDDNVPANLEQVVNIILMRGITPILAHVERCRYLRQEPMRLLNLIRMGALAQISARAFFSRGDHKFAKLCLKNGLCHIIASDTHDQYGSDPCITEILRKIDKELLHRAEKFARAVWDNDCLPAFSIYPVRRGLLGYY